LRAPLARRTLLRGAAGATLALPFLEAMRGVRRAAAATPVRRVIFFMTGNGVPPELWRPARAEDPTSSAMLAPLSPWKDKVLALEGISLSSSYDPASKASPHPAGTAAVLTGSYAGPPDGRCNVCNFGFAIGESVDVPLARALGKDTRFPSLHVGANVFGTSVFTRFFYAAPRQPTTPIDDPTVVYGRLFSDQLAGGGAAARVRLARRRSVLDAVLDDLRGLDCQVGAEDRARLDAHATTVRELERRLAIGANAARCSTPSVPAGAEWKNWMTLPTTVKAQLDLAVSALACDLTRVVGIQIGSPDSPGGYYPFLGTNDAHHHVSHLLGPTPRDFLRAIGTWQVEQIAYLAKQLAALPGETGSLLDSTAIVWSSDVGNPWTHDRKNVPFTIVGNAGGYFKSGRYLKYSATNRHAHNRLLLHLLALAGSEVRTFGAPGYDSGGLLEDLT
jgi:hypothetical protein